MIGMILWLGHTLCDNVQSETTKHKLEWHSELHTANKADDPTTVLLLNKYQIKHSQCCRVFLSLHITFITRFDCVVRVSFSLFKHYGRYKIPRGSPSVGALNTWSGEKLWFFTEIVFYLGNDKRYAQWSITMDHYRKPEVLKRSVLVSMTLGDLDRWDARSHFSAGSS